MLKKENVELRTQQHLMYIEGTADEKPTASEIKEYANERGYEVSDIDIFWDNFQGFYIFSGKLSQKHS